ncbi:MAG TPA: WS/DGAT domain-containing protein, partial [Acidimicrobiales bacterium]|nr:WS/DGAT domain-containing protein [Acidimicrobiales bacterium]
ARVRWDRAHHQELAPDLFLRLLTPLPQAVLSRLTALVHHQPLFNLVVTNVPGPGFPLYLLGAKMLEAIPVVPLAGNLTLGVAGLSYDGKFTVGLLADPEACPDLDKFVHGMERSLEHLRRHGKERVDDRTDQP